MYPEGVLRQVGDEELTKIVLEQKNPEEVWKNIMNQRSRMQNYDPSEEDDEKMAEEDNDEQIQHGKDREKEINVSVESVIVKKSLNIPSLENDLINDVLGKEECVHDPDIDVMDCDPESEVDDWDIVDEEESSIDSDDIEGIDDVGIGEQPDKNRNLSHLKPWEKTLPEFVVGQMAHNPCGPNVPGGTKRRCWIGGKCVTTFYNYHSEFSSCIVVRRRKCHVHSEMSQMEM